MQKKDYTKDTISVYNAIAKDYAKKVEEYGPVPERDKFISFLPKGAKILDAGCGSGRDSRYFVSKGFNVMGVDLSEKLLEIAKQNNPSITFFKQDLRKLDFPQESFDGIWACASLHHLRRSEVPKVLKKFFSLLKPRGALFVLVKEGTGEEDVQESLSSGLPRHYVYYSLNELKKLLEDAGFSIVDIYTWREEERRSGRSDLVWVTSFSKK